MKEKFKLSNLLDVAKRFPTEESCINYLIQIRWDGKPVCTFCGSDEKTYKINGGKLLKCSKCRKQFTVRKGTIFEDSALPLQKWFFAVFLLTAHKKGISSCQLARDISITQKSAWFVLHRIRHALKTGSFDKGPLKNVVECDETYVGGHRSGKRGRGAEGKTPVFGMKERGGDVVTMPVKRVDGATLKGLIRENIDKDATVMTDEWTAYNNLGKEYDHKVINHRRKEYAIGDIHVNGIENFWSLLKRGILGIYHHVSPEHLKRYCDEFAFRHNTRGIADVDRFGDTLGKCEARLTYQELIN